MLVLTITDDVEWIDFHGPRGEHIRVHDAQFPTESGRIFYLYSRGACIGYLFGKRRFRPRKDGRLSIQIGKHLGVRVPPDWQVWRSNAPGRPRVPGMEAVA